LCGDYRQPDLFPREELATLFAHTGSVRACDGFGGMNSISLLMRHPAVSAAMSRDPCVLNQRTSIVMTCFIRKATPFLPGASNTVRKMCRWAGNAGGAGRSCGAALAWRSARDYASHCGFAEGTECVNQAIQFPDREDGMRRQRSLFRCWLMACSLPAQLGLTFCSVLAVRPAVAGRFVKIAGIWKRSQRLIRDQQEDDQGWVWLS
jgi:hypothetical protein